MPRISWREPFADNDEPLLFDRLRVRALVMLRPIRSDAEFVVDRLKFRP